MRFSSLFLLFAFFCLSACSKDDYDQEIEDYLSKNNLSAQKTVDGLYYIIEEPGNSKHPVLNSDIRVKYKGYFTDGTVFDQSNDIEFNLSDVITGWRKGMVLFGEGGKGKLLIPPQLAYGENGSGSVPGNTVIIFDVELLEVL